MGPSQAIELYQKVAIIKQMNKNLAISFVVVVCVTVASVVTYSNFINTSSFNFTNLNQPKVVKGSSTHSFITPIPASSIELSSDISKTSGSKVIETSRDRDRLINYYKKFFMSEDFGIIGEESLSNSYVLEFQKELTTVKLILSDTDYETTLVSIQESYEN